jgi:hypothetical protein
MEFSLISSARRIAARCPVTVISSSAFESPAACDAAGASAAGPLSEDPTETSAASATL